MLNVHFFLVKGFRQVDGRWWKSCCIDFSFHVFLCTFVCGNNAPKVGDFFCVSLHLSHIIVLDLVLCGYVVVFISSVYLVFTFRTALALNSASPLNFVYESLRWWKFRLISSRKSRSSSWLVRVHCMPVLLSFVACLITQSITIRGDKRHTCLTPVFTLKAFDSSRLWIFAQLMFLFDELSSNGTIICH